MTRVASHRMPNGEDWPFDHLCPGEGCAVEKWLWWLANGRSYETWAETAERFETERFEAEIAEAKVKRVCE